MGLGAFVILFAVQAAIALVVIVVLKSLLDKELVEAALEKLQASKSVGSLDRIVVRSAKLLSDVTQQRVQVSAQKIMPQGKIDYQQDPALGGGVIIEVGGEILDFSLSTRLRNFWS